MALGGVAALASAIAASGDLPARPGRLVVQVVDTDLADAARARAIPLRVYPPESGGPYPVILFSHGLGSTRAGYGYLARSWASHGYVSGDRVGLLDPIRPVLAAEPKHLTAEGRRTLLDAAGPGTSARLQCPSISAAIARAAAAGSTASRSGRPITSQSAPSITVCAGVPVRC